ncbi:MAG: glycoside hydrolase family 13 protein [Intrasporangiaceae bacterium]|nr:glycoside hydrolase family 13 protein [Intrasporangiaceae bacterium]
MQTTLLHTGPDLDREAALPWWRTAVIYQVYPRSWADSDGDGVGDLPGIIDRLPYLRDLGVDALWLSPFYVSPMNDAGYDVADYQDIDPLFGTLQDADRLISTAHDLGLKVITDLVPNHSSSEHPWFQAALAAGPGSPERDRYIFRDGLGPDGAEPPSDWLSVFGGPGWSRVSERDGSPGQWYLHLFDVTQPDFDWHNPEVVESFHEHLRFWLDRGVDGFRVDVAHSLFKDMSFPSWPYGGEMLVPDHLHDSAGPMWDQDGVHEIYRGWRELLEEYTGRDAGRRGAEDVEGDPDADRILVAEAWVSPAERLARYVRPDEMHQAFNFDFLEAGWDPQLLPSVIADSYANNDAVDAPTTWVLSNHDVVRHASRFGLEDPTHRPNGIGPDDPQPDAALGLARARAATTLMLGLPGSAYLYQGEELGLPDATELPGEVRQDPTYLRTDHAKLGRDGCRIPMPWTREGPSFGFGPSEDTWLPQPAVYGELAVDQQDGVAGSTLELYRTLLRLRRERHLAAGTIEQVRTPEGLLAYIVTSPAGERTGIVLNAGTEAAALPLSGDLLVHSVPDADLEPGLAPDSAVWLALD